MVTDGEKLTAWLFRLHRLESGQHAAWAVVCPQARYCSLAVPGASVLVRRMLTPADWKAIEAEIALGVNPGPLPADGALGRALTGEVSRSVVCQYVTARGISARPAEVAGVLDAWIREHTQGNIGD